MFKYTHTHTHYYTAKRIISNNLRLRFLACRNELSVLCLSSHVYRVCLMIYIYCLFAVLLIFTRNTSAGIASFGRPHFNRNI